jgi:hypothetical protein
MKKAIKKLHLNRETLLNLEENLRAAVGGLITDGPTCDRTDTCTQCSKTCK